MLFQDQKSWFWNGRLERADRQDKRFKKGLEVLKNEAVNELGIVTEVHLMHNDNNVPAQ